MPYAQNAPLQVQNQERLDVDNLEDFKEDDIDEFILSQGKRNQVQEHPH